MECLKILIWEIYLTSGDAENDNAIAQASMANLCKILKAILNHSRKNDQDSYLTGKKDQDLTTVINNRNNKGKVK